MQTWETGDLLHLREVYRVQPRLAWMAPSLGMVVEF